MSSEVAASQSVQSPPLDAIGSYFVNQWRNTSSKTLGRKPEATSKDETESSIDSDDEECPTELDTLNSSGGFVVVSPDKLSLWYPNVNQHGQDVGVVQANRPAPSKCYMYYFEMTVVNAGAKGQIAIGFTTSEFRLRRQPGWEEKSYGYHGDDGFLYFGTGKGKPFAEKFSTGDTVGAGMNNSARQIFFTKNGKFMGATSRDVIGSMYPTVAVHSQNEKVTVNFGKDPFVFDIKKYEDDERAKQQLEIDSVSIPQDASYGLVRSYLQHYGYQQTLELFNMAGETTFPPVASENGFSEKDCEYELDRRMILRKSIQNGYIDDAFTKLNEWYPQILQDDKSNICFLLHCQKFIELVRNGKLDEAIQHGRKEFDKFKELTGFDDLIKDAAALLAYEEPHTSSVGYLLSNSQRELVADAVNAVVLSTNPELKDSKVCLYSRLEMIIRQITACYWEKRDLDWKNGELFKLSRFLKSDRKV